MLQNDLLQYYGKYMYLKIYVDDLHLKETYLEAVRQHHVKMTRDLRHADAGFDFICPKRTRDGGVHSYHRFQSGL